MELAVTVLKENAFYATDGSVLNALERDPWIYLEEDSI